MLNANINRELSTVTVEDTEGGVWRPDAGAKAEILAAADPDAKAVEICEAAPMRGTWKQ